MKWLLFKTFEYTAVSLTVLFVTIELYMTWLVVHEMLFMP